MIAYSSHIRRIEEIGYFKANDFFKWLCYVGPTAMRGRLD